MTDHAHALETTTGLDSRKLAIWTFIGSECMFFATLISNYLVHKGKSLVGPFPHEVWKDPATGKVFEPIIEIPLVTVGTALLHLSGVNLLQLGSEYRALRTSVVKLWRSHLSKEHHSALDDLKRFNESVDQALAESIASYSDEVANSRDTFLAILGHDLRSPLSAVSMSAQYLATSGKVVAEGQPALVRIRRSVLTMSLMIKDLLEYTRARLGKRIPVTPLAYDVGQVCEAAHDEVLAAHPDRVFDLEMDGDLRAEVDPARLGQVLSNLLNNAIQYGALGFPITLSARGERDIVVIEVKNQGPAIPEDALQVIFNPLVQLRTEHGGSPDPLSTSLGLGLFIAREIVMGHGGTLKVESSSPEGTVFRVALPRIFQEQRRR